MSDLQRRPTVSENGDDLGHVDMGGNFWDIGNYKMVLKRINTGAKLCDELVKLMNERAAIEKQYAKGLLGWAERWEEKLRVIGEQYTLRDGWQSMLTEARGLSDIHTNLKDRLEREMTDDIETWKKQNYVKSFFSWKSCKRAQTAFEKAQAPWSKRKEKILKYKRNIETHSAHAELLRRQVAATDTAAKVKAQLEKEEREVEKYKAKMKQRVDDMIRYHDVYRHDMTVEFERCQQEEKMRVEFFKSTLLSYHQRTDFTRNYDSVHANMLATVNRVNPQEDVDRFSKEHGAGMPYVLPTETGEFRTVQDPSEIKKVDRNPPAPAANNGGSASSASQAAAEPPLYSPGSKLRALYDYAAAKGDELSFAFDDVLIVLPPPANVEKGWILCRAENGSATGIVPENYVEEDEV